MKNNEIKQTIANLMGLDLSDPVEGAKAVIAAFEVEGDVIVSENEKGNCIAYLDEIGSEEFEIIEDSEGIIIEVNVY